MIFWNNREFRIHEYLLLFDFVVGIAIVIIHYSITSNNASILCLLWCFWY